MSETSIHHATRLSRRGFVQTGFIALTGSLIARPVTGSFLPQSAQDSLAGRGERGTLRDPAAAGRSRTPTSAGENDPEIKAIEQRLACNCGCTLDVFTCRTTDFSCTYSPALHREVVALRDSGKTAREILDSFVAKYGEKALMAPKPQGFNLAGYFLPGAAIAAAGAALVWFIGRRKQNLSPAPAQSENIPASVQASPAELERLRSALAELED
ncbi:MAG TPA: cytochrome c-type biogenesis protein CcmH [Gemmatimonadales bacterium]|nr:cytochrome c-type biogenesis protein CcmH [Gemmatimonadales bacterium]